MLDQDPDTKGPKTGKNYLDTKRPKSGNSDLPSKGILSYGNKPPVNLWQERRVLLAKSLM